MNQKSTPNATPNSANSKAGGGRHASRNTPAGQGAPTQSLPTQQQTAFIPVDPTKSSHRRGPGSHGAASAAKPVGTPSPTPKLPQTPKPPLSRKKKALIAVAASVVAILAIAGVALALYVNHINSQLTRGDKSDQEIQEINETLAKHTDYSEPFYMLLLGSDARPWESTTGTRSDVNIVARIDPKEGLVTLVSIPRDTKITIEGHGTCKFNAAYAYGGAAGAIKAANQLLGIQISHYAEVDFSKLMDLIDSIGGVDVDVDVTINDRNADLNSAEEHIIIEKGLQHLSGKEALVYARSRAFADGDFTRTAHQRTLITAVIDKLFALPLTSLPSAIDGASKCVTTDMSVTDLLSLAEQFKQHDELTVYSAMLPSTTAMIGGVSYVINDEAATKEMMELVEKGEDPSTVNPTSTPQSFVQDGNVSVPDVPDSSYGYQAPSTPSTNQSGNGGSGNGEGNNSGNDNEGNTTPDDPETPGTNPDGNNPDGNNPGTNPDGEGSGGNTGGEGGSDGNGGSGGNTGGEGSGGSGGSGEGSEGSGNSGAGPSDNADGNSAASAAA